MCGACWRDYGSPKVNNERVRAAAILVRDLYAVSFAGARAHIVTDDWNIEDDNLQWCIEHGTSSSDVEDRLALDVLSAFIGLSVEERASALALEAGMWDWREDGAAAHVERV